MSVGGAHLMSTLPGPAQTAEVTLQSWKQEMLANQSLGAKEFLLNLLMVALVEE